MNDTNELAPAESKDDANQRARRTMAIVAAGLVGAGLSIVVVIVALVLRGRQSLPEITRESFDAAVAQWDAVGPADYDLTVVVTGRQPATYAVSVRDGEAVSLTRNGIPLTSARVFGTWSVPGMFGTIQRDLETLAGDAADATAGKKPRLTIRGQFAPQLGYPSRYQRIEWGTDMEVSWEVTKFEAVDAGP